MPTSPNQAPRPQGVKPTLIILHSTECAYDVAVAWLCNPKSEVSAHYVVSRAGETVQLVPPEHTAWHAGKSVWHGEAVRGSVNAFSLGIEMEHFDGKQDWPEAQLTAVAALCRTLMGRYGIVPEAIRSHAEVATPPGRKVDPRDFPWSAFRARLTPAPAAVLPDGRRVEGVLLHDTLYVPARDMADALGLTGVWEQEAQEYQLKKR